MTLPSSVKSFCEEMQMRTGWSFTVLCGGPEPTNNGRIRTIPIHVGVDQIFSKAHGDLLNNLSIHFQHSSKMSTVCIF